VTRWDPPLKQERPDSEALRAKLRDWLAQRWPDVRDLRLSPLERPKDSGVSNETVLFDAEWDGGSRRLVGRLQNNDPLYFEVGVDLQYRMYDALADAPGVVVPGLVAFEPDPEVLGTPFFVMERVDGDVPPGLPHFTKAGWLLEASPAERERLWRSAVEQLVALHRLDGARFPFLEHPERGPTGLDQDLAYWRAYYRWAAGSERYPIIEAGEAWLLEHQPRNPAPGLSWGDARIENMIFRDFRCVAVLDFETASLAGPTADVAWWALMDKGSAVLPGLASPKETLQLYRELGGPEPTDLHWYLVLCAFRLASVYVRLAHQLEARGQLERKDLATNSEKIQQLALLLELPPPGPVTATLPDLDL
jgi:aminoglycoside phosphotransferase (APT) family kinase protein